MVFIKLLKFLDSILIQTSLFYPTLHLGVVSRCDIKILSLQIKIRPLLLAHPTFSPAEAGNIIGFERFHFSVRNGKRWDTFRQSTNNKGRILFTNISSTSQI